MHERSGTARDDFISRAAGHPRGFAAGAGAPAGRPSRRGQRICRQLLAAGPGDSTLLAQVLNNAPGDGNNMAKRTEGTKKLLNQVFPCVFLAVVFATGAPIADGKELDNRRITGRAFLASGQNNMAALISWLRGYHAGKSGVVPYQFPDAYGGRLGFYCQQHPDDNLIEASEKILTVLDQ